jgi:kinesin family protein 1
MFGPTDLTLRISIFAKVTAVHLDKLLSFDNLRDQQQTQKVARIAETHFFNEEKHDVFARVQVLELSESGEYLPVEVVKTGDMDPGTFQLHQGLQRRFVINLTHSCGGVLPWTDIKDLRVGNVKLLDQSGRVVDENSLQESIYLKPVLDPVTRNSANGTTQVILVGQWDSSLHNSLLIDRITSDKYKLSLALSWSIHSPKLGATQPLAFTLDIHALILSRSYLRQPSMLSALFGHVKIVKSVPAIFSISVRPTPVKRVGDLWRMNSQGEYVKGEEGLRGWAPRGVSLVKDFVAGKGRRARRTEVESAKAVMRSEDLRVVPRVSAVAELNDDNDLESNAEVEHADATNADAAHSNGDAPEDAQVKGVAQESNGDSTIQTAVEAAPLPEEQLVGKILKLWTITPDPISNLLRLTNTEPPTDGASDPNRDTAPRLIASISLVPKNPTVLKSGLLYLPSSDSTRWIRRHVELRKPYLHIFSVPDGEEVGVVQLRNSRVDHMPVIAQLMKPAKDEGRGDGTDGRDKVWAVYGTENTWLFRGRSEKEKCEWIFAVDQAYFGDEEE